MAVIILNQKEITPKTQIPYGQNSTFLNQMSSPTGASEPGEE